MNTIRLDGNDGTHPNKNGNFCDDENKAITCLNPHMKLQSGI